MASKLTICGALRAVVVQRAMASTNVSPDMMRFRSSVMNSSGAKLNRYGGRHSVTVLPGDGIGPEMLEHVQKIFSFGQVPVDFECVHLSSKPDSVDDLEQAIIAIKRNGVALKNIDMIIIRENTEGEYSGLEHETTPGIVESLKIVTRSKIERISRFAFQYAKKYDRKKVTAVHKANIQKLGDGLFLQVCKEIGEKEYPEIKFESMIVDNASMQLVSRPQQFDIMLMPNLYGNIISNIACGLVGGPGLVSGMNIGNEYAVFETGTRNTGTSLAGKNRANPTAFIRAAADMLRYLGLEQHANLVSDSLYRTLVEKRIHTPDIGGTATTSEVIDSVLEFVEKEMEESKWRAR
ncbi:putative isocitrate dehydrogenase, NAD-dependent [Ancylostoma ceylanicum]|uniref:Putative isocitrate dehydrogenase, NAD-dependent n=1 Tax=Ancylostoma ceylanicum TaxID=53326 RepID=A0A0D6L9W5_9BILA|nr:putative isocitrate dehydrogenase, NAD-dependent [Ancylostoma ceylanicum]